MTLTGSQSGAIHEIRFLCAGLYQEAVLTEIRLCAFVY